MADLTMEEFAHKVVSDKKFKNEVLGMASDFVMPGEGANGIGMWFAAGAEKMGYDFDADELDAAIKAEVETLGGFKKATFIAGIINSARKNKVAKR